MEYLYWGSLVAGIGYILYAGYSGRIGKMIRQITKPEPYSHISTPDQLWKLTTPTAYKTYVINFPDGVVTTDKEFTNIPDYTTWSEPMVELFLLIVKDWRNWSYEVKQTVLKDIKVTFLHKNTGVVINKVSWGITELYINGCWNRAACHRYNHNALDTYEIERVVKLAKIWKQVYYGDKLSRIARIKELRSERTRKENEAKQAELNKQARSEEAKKIREYLEGVGK